MNIVMIFITSNISLTDDEVHFTAVRASGPGGQHVNTTNSAVQLKFDAVNCPALHSALVTRLRRACGTRMNSDGVITLQASNERSQHRNRAKALDRLITLIRVASIPPRHRRKTKPSKGSVERRLKGKNRTSGLKKSRGRISSDD